MTDAHIASPQRTPAPFGPLLRQWRSHKGLSQLALALEANVSQRHLSFVESGRASPSRDMIGRIAGALDLPLRARNDLLLAAGFAPTYAERSLDQAELARVRAILERILTHHEPYPAMVLDRSWNLVMRNEANRRVVAAGLDGAAPESVAPGHANNFLRLMFGEKGIRRRIRNWHEVCPAMLARVRREARAYPGSPSEALLAELTAMAGDPDEGVAAPDLLSPTVPLELEVERGVLLRLTNTLTTFGTPQDVSVQEFRIEMSFPVDDVTDAYLRRAAAAPRRE
jgi:transcriptional regulator with XRE-family HTH domain